MRLILLAVFFIFSAFYGHTQNSQSGGQYKELGEWEVHYIAFPSTFIQPSVAKAYGVVRSESKALINISVLATDKAKTAQQVQISGFAKNLLGNKKQLNFKQVVEGDAIYYLAQLDYYNEDVYRFELNIKQGNEQQVLKFQQKFYVD
ncbi:DUF4426 domain-containing protein [Pseudoalteromonas luteoviolacea]|uniref:DUF4426 domain-containing protein n=1 Tax=Pseudoalteromonas luteoviolacea S4054 TaxID=1129367 RepID=A0A0F6AI05_9GAMM|nr:DUF4426 domain-containing protein [Pseudoalteromonas luteoviolacea]AOT07168.1 hypothetical protein S4054249_04535 [Pseudoalteromonas luteoviolacea]AOT12084.1 hypothetical protein S40542_04535 [Pseudoalteromonas luteoviolacea]AOT16997.1 hypothetical protein S4054_04535 [Pseudoalteromonas luteoviolacea]KKE85411.1 hypothetical protein N479_05250 [Pseudoalteromonas luteoviolacea S4054]KZN73759.1 hypothetical protein N481_11660 [Pseudoalteromonas luteoviolacea S4047-1]